MFKDLHVGPLDENCQQRLFKCHKNKLDKSKLTKNFHKSYSINDNLNVTILKNNIKTAGAWRYNEDKWIFRLKVQLRMANLLKSVSMLNKYITSSNLVTNSVRSFDIMFT